MDKHPVCQEVRTYLGGTGKKGSDVRKHFTGVVYGWPKDAVDGALLALLASGFVRATQRGQPMTAKQIIQSQIGITQFYDEGVTITAIQRIAVRKLLSDLGLPYVPNEEMAAIPRLLQKLVEWAGEAGRPPPLPEKPSTAKVEELRALGGNDQFVAVYDARQELLSAAQAWIKAQDKIAQRQPRWQVLQRLLKHAETLPVAAQVAPQVMAIQAERALLDDPDPVTPLISQLTDALRAALQDAHDRLQELHQREMAGLEATQEWQAIGESDRQDLLVSNGLSAVPDIQVGTEQALLNTLDDMPLNTWEDTIAALPTRVEQARKQAACMLEPKAVYVKTKPATLKSPEEADAYLQDLREDIIHHINAGRPVIL